MAYMPDFLTHSRDSDPGISRRVRGRGFSYHHPDGTTVTCEGTRARIDALGLPPAWTDVWICAHEHGHLQATGRDARERKQYRYHELWRAHRDRLKYASLPAFGEALPALRQRVYRDLRRERPDRDFVCAALVRLIDRAALRVGNPEYADRNGSFGATTLRTRHVRLGEEDIRLDFRAKGGKRVRRRVGDRTLHRVLGRIDDLPGRELFRYVDEDGEVRSLDSSDVNAYLGQTLDDDFTAKTFRTWRGTVEAFAEACEAPEPSIKGMCERAAAALHNTPAICRSSYIHPDVIALAEMDADAREAALEGPKAERRDGLRKAEAGLLAFLGG